MLLPTVDVSRRVVMVDMVGWKEIRYMNCESTFIQFTSRVAINTEMGSKGKDISPIATVMTVMCLKVVKWGRAGNEVMGKFV